jgi:RecJ-like exonuclease
MNTTINCPRCDGTGLYWMANAMGDKTCYKCSGSGKMLINQPKVKTVNINSNTKIGDYVDVKTALGWAVCEVVEQYTRENATEQALRFMNQRGSTRARLARRLTDGKRFWI